MRDVPSRLKCQQEWFAAVITQPIDQDSRINPTAPSGKSIVEEASHHILPSHTLEPHKRLELYNQQYWWRLLSTLHDLYPFLTRVFGYSTFNQQIAIPYLVKYPPFHWLLSLLGDRLPKWVDEAYIQDDRDLVLTVSSIDWAFNESFLAKELEAITSKTDLEKMFTLQPHIHLFEFASDLFKAREAFLKEDPDYYLDHPFPEIQPAKSPYFILFRNQQNSVQVKSLSQPEYAMLSFFQRGASIDDLVKWVTTQDNSFQQEVAQNLEKWIGGFVSNRWLTLEAKR